MPRKRKAAREFRRHPNRITPERETSLLDYFAWIGSEPLETAFRSDSEALACWKRHREYLTQRWAELVARGHRAAGEMPWGMWLERGGTSPKEWLEHNRRVPGEGEYVLKQKFSKGEIET